jgi:hypothetical protein
LKEIVPEGFLRLSDAARRLAEGMWGSLRRPEPLRAIAPKFKRRVSVGFGPWAQEAAKCLRAVAVEGKLSVYVSANAPPTVDNAHPPPVVVPKSVLSRLIPSRGGFPDHAVRSSWKISCGDDTIFKLLATGVLLVHAREFNKWYRSEMAKGKWPSQRARLKPKQGRPSKATDALRCAIVAKMREGQITVAALRRDLLADGRTDVPSADTLARLQDQLFREMGEAHLRRRRRRAPVRV